MCFFRFDLIDLTNSSEVQFQDTVELLPNDRSFTVLRKFFLARL